MSHYASQYFQSIHTRHVDVEQCHVPLAMAHFFQGINSVHRFGGDHDIRCFTKKPLQAVPQKGMVIG